LAGWLIWLVTLAMVLWPLWDKRVRHNWSADERMARNRLMAMVVGYWCMILGLVGAGAFAIFTGASVLDLVRMLAIVAVAAPVLAVAVLEAADGREG
jgi:hypothetical protein